MSDMIDRLKQAIKETMTPQEFEDWEQAMEEIPPLEMEGYYARMDQEQPCIVDAFFRSEAKKPAHLRKNYCHISCPCPKCSPRM